MKMINRLGFVAVAMLGGAVACSGKTGATGPQGEPGPAGDAGSPATAGSATAAASISAIIPTSVFVGRDASVTISGYATSWSSTTTVDFGADVTVGKITVASPTSLVVALTIASTATLGPRDVKVTDGTSTETYSAAFNITTPDVVTVEGTAAQGSIFLLHVTDPDLQNPFDNTTGQDADGNTTYPNFNVKETPASILFFTDSVNLFEADIATYVDLDAPTTAGSLTFLSGTGSAVTSFPAPNAYTIAPRTPTPFGAGTPVTVSFAQPYVSSLYSYTPSSILLTVIDVALTPGAAANTNSPPSYIRLPKSGHFADAIENATASTFSTFSTDPMYFIPWDASGSSGYTATLTATASAAHVVNYAEGNVGMSTAQTLSGTMPYVVQSLVLPDADSAIWFKYTVAAGSTDIGKSFRVVTEQGPTGDPNVDALVEICDASGNVEQVAGVFGAQDDSSDTGAFTNFLSGTVLAEGDYYVVFMSGQSWTSSATSFQAIVRTEATGS